MKVDFENKVVIITGATSGIGRGMALMFAQNDVTVVVNGNLPGSIEIPKMTEGDQGIYNDGRFGCIMSHIPFKSPGTPENIGYGAMYLASDAASYVTGNIPVIDGGWTCGFAREL